MNKPNPKMSVNNHFPLEQLQKIVRQDKRQARQLVSKKILPPNIVMKNHSKSLYYSNNLNRIVRPNILNTVNKTTVHDKSLNVNYVNHQTLNEQLLCMQRPKPQTSHCNSSRNKAQQRNLPRSNKISLRSSANYNRLSSVAGISLNQKQAQQRMQSQLYTKSNIRNSKLNEIRKQNKRLSERLQSQQSQYSTKKLLKDYESQQKISRRLTESKMSKRSHSIQDNRSICSEHSSRSSVKSRSSNGSQTSSMKSTGRNYLPRKLSNKKNTVNRLQAKLINVGAKNIRIQEHNINKLSQDEFSKFKKLFGNSFSTVKPQKVTINHSYAKMLIKNNPYADVEVMSQHSQQSSQKSLDSKKRIQIYTTNNSNRKLKQFNFDLPNNNNRTSHEIPKKSSVIASDGLLHRIAQQMYTISKNGRTDDITDRQNKKKKESTNTNTKSLQQQQNKVRNYAKYSQRKPHKAEQNYPILPTNLMFGKM